MTTLLEYTVKYKQLILYNTLCSKNGPFFLTDSNAEILAEMVE